MLFVPVHLYTNTIFGFEKSEFLPIFSVRKKRNKKDNKKGKKEKYTVGKKKKKKTTREREK